MIADNSIAAKKALNIFTAQELKRKVTEHY